MLKNPMHFQYFIEINPYPKSICISVLYVGLSIVPKLSPYYAIVFFALAPLTTVSLSSNYMISFSFAFTNVIVNRVDTDQPTL